MHRMEKITRIREILGLALERQHEAETSKAATDAVTRRRHLLAQIRLLTASNNVHGDVAAFCAQRGAGEIGDLETDDLQDLIDLVLRVAVVSHQRRDLRRAPPH